MDVVHERRVGKERRQFAIYYRYGCEHRNNTGNRRLDSVEKLQPYLTGRASRACGRGTDGTVEMIKEIAETFGVDPDTLEMLEHNHSADSTEKCPSCEDQATINAELVNELAESRRNFELCRSQVGDLLMSLSTAKNEKQ